MEGEGILGCQWKGKGRTRDGRGKRVLRGALVRNKEGKENWGRVLRGEWRNVCNEGEGGREGVGVLQGD